MQPVRQSSSVSLTEQVNTPPASVEAEQALLGALMLDANSWELVGDRLADADFYRPDHRLIFAGLRALAERDRPRDAVTVSEYLDARGELLDAGGIAYLGSLVKDTPSAANVRTYAEIVRERSLLRDLIAVGNEIAASAFNTEGRPATDLVDDAEKRIYQIAEQGMAGKRSFRHLKDVCGPMIDRLDQLHRDNSEITGLSTGYKKFDAMTQGLQKGDLIILAGRPSMGKTTLALNIAENAAFNPMSPTPIAVFSMEMSTEQLALRFVSSLGRVSQGNLRNGQFADDDWPRINSAIQQMSMAPVFIDDTPALTPTQVRARARRLKRQHDIGLIVRRLPAAHVCRWQHRKPRDRDIGDIALTEGAGS